MRLKPPPKDGDYAAWEVELAARCPLGAVRDAMAALPLPLRDLVSARPASSVQTTPRCR